MKTPIRKPGQTHVKKETLRWPRADPVLLAKFDPSTKVCTMNCGPSREDPRSAKERKLLCEDCLVVGKDKMRGTE